MLTAGAIVSLIAISGYLFLNWRALDSHGLTWERKAAFGAAWVGIFAIVGFLFSRLAG
jgi:hypothetical protein